MADIEAAIGMECYAAFALQQPLSLDELAAAAERAELPIATGAAPDPSLLTGPVGSLPSEPTPSEDRLAALLAAAPELAGRRLTD